MDLNLDRPAPATVAMEQASHEVQAIFQNASIGIALTRDRVIVRCNEAFANMLGHTQTSLTSLPVRQIFPSDDAYEHLVLEARALLVAGETYRAENHFVRQDGSLVFCAVSASPVDRHHPEWGTIWLLTM